MLCVVLTCKLDTCFLNSWVHTYHCFAIFLYFLPNIAFELTLKNQDKYIKVRIWLLHYVFHGNHNWEFTYLNTHYFIINNKIYVVHRFYKNLCVRVGHVLCEFHVRIAKVGVPSFSRVPLLIVQPAWEGPRWGSGARKGEARAGIKREREGV